MRTLLPVIASLAVAAGCAARPPAASLPAPLPAVDIDALFRRGCYTCLETAHAAAVRGGAREKAAEAALLLAARSKELGLAPGPWLRRAAEMLPAGPDWAAYYDIVNTLPADPLSDDRDLLLAEDVERRRPREVWDGWRERLQAGPGSPLLRAYLDLSIACRRDIVARNVDNAARDAATEAAMREFANVPLLQYRAGLCGGAEFEQLTAAREADPEFLDADLELGRRAIQNRVPPDTVEGLRRLQSARAAFPRSPVIPVVIGNVHEVREEWPEALAAYDEALAIVPTHRDALLGRTISLSNLDEYAEALAAASRLLELGNWFVGAAHYWRAWNQYQLGWIKDARADADSAKAMMLNPPLYVLSGMIEWRERRLESAAQEFEKAIEMDAGQCEAGFYLGSVRWERLLWDDSLAAFEQAQRCFEEVIETRREAIAALSAPGEAAANARQIASHERAVAEAETRREQAAKNIATIRSLASPTAPR
jgi:tetratricopeptide (TPR) repeat protein